MKKISSLIALILIIIPNIKLIAQNNLQFNRVVYFQISTTSDSKDTNITIQTNKVWKVESVGVTQIGICGNYRTELFKINNSTVCANEIASAFVHYNNNFPIWLSTGTHKFGVTTTSSCGGIRGYVSAIEYNIVP
jgi:hypothetical protein